MELYIYVNGKFFEKSKAMGSVFEHGLLYGDGVFETLRAYNGKVLFLSQHINRLFESASSIHLTIQQTPEELKSILFQTLKKNHLHDAYLRISVTRGVGDIGLNPTLCSNTSLVVIAKPFSGHQSELYEHGIQISIVKTRRNSSQAINPQIKSLNFLNNILAYQEAWQKGSREAIMLNLQGHLCEGSVSNLFWINKETLKTPDLSCGILAGITRNEVIRIALSLGILVKEGHYPSEDLILADEAFITNTTYEVMPVTAIEKNPVNDGKVGKITKNLLQEYRKDIPHFLFEG